MHTSVMDTEVPVSAATKDAAWDEISFPQEVMPEGVYMSPQQKFLIFRLKMV